jgi:hypothetical protein
MGKESEKMILGVDKVLELIKNKKYKFLVGTAENKKY